ncbi:MAG: Hsp20/alpha crystallin family protein [Planctomycetota bacterium]|jgi:HSP20 family protein
MAFLPRKRSKEETGGLISLQDDMNRLFDRFFDREAFPGFFGRESFAPAVDVVETAEEVQVKAEIPGVDPQALDISITGDALTIKGEKKAEREKKEENYHVVERSYGSFSRTVSLPPYADTKQVSADYKDGVLVVHLKKSGESESKTIQVDVK